MPSALNTGGSLPDLTTLHFPSPLPTPLDPEEAPYPPLSGGSSTSNLATTMTHLGISGTGGVGLGYDPPGEPGPLPTLGAHGRGGQRRSRGWELVWGTQGPPWPVWGDTKMSPRWCPEAAVAAPGIPVWDGGLGMGWRWGLKDLGVPGV